MRAKPRGRRTGRMIRIWRRRVISLPPVAPALKVRKPRTTKMASRRIRSHRHGPKPEAAPQGPIPGGSLLALFPGFFLQESLLEGKVSIVLGIRPGDNADLFTGFFSRNGGGEVLLGCKHHRFPGKGIAIPGAGWLLAVKIAQELAEGGQVLTAGRTSVGIIGNCGPATFTLHSGFPIKKLSAQIIFSKEIIDSGTDRGKEILFGG